ncbi:PfkB family carbohydrate kinase [uncultured Draconibacterium sp.]|uniref:PfkB family carbohydrate kinase n=1 Tax=uncultured Draconibacterium sp. TaxID=1573823 RepID=UPI0032619F1D
MKHKALFVGLTTIDIQYFIKELPESNTKLKTTAPEVLVGGPATNAAVAFAYLNKSAILASPTGYNAFENLVHNDFKSVGITHFDLANKQLFSPVYATVLTSENGDRTIITHNPNDTESVISANELIEKVNPEILLIDGFYPEFSSQCARICKQKGIPVVADCGSWKPQFFELLDSVEIAICSADFMPPECNTKSHLFDFMRNKGVQKIAISNGGEQLVFQNGTEGAININPIQVKDTLGAGDFLHGAFCYYYLLYNDFTIALKKASGLATFTCGFYGTREWLKFKHDA